MVQNDKSKMNPKTKIGIIAGIAVVVIAVAVVCIVFARNGYLATTMRLLRIEGTVNLEDSKGSTKPVVENLRFQSGDAINTGADGLATIGLDDAKIVTLDHNSRAEFKKKKNQLELNLTKGALFFNVTEKLKSDEKFDIKTSTMTAGIRGTSGIVYYDETDDLRETIAITDGVVEISATNPDTGETRTAKVEAGKQLKVYLYSDRPGESVQFEIFDIKEEDLGKFTVGLIADNDELIKKICDYTGWDPDKLKKILKGLNVDPTDPTEPTVPTDPEVPTEPTKPTDPTNEDPPTEPTSTTTAKKTKTTKKKKTTTKKTTTTKKKKKKSTSSAPSVPSGYSKYIWGASYNGKKIYIVHQDHELFKGYSGGKWIELFLEFSETDSGYTETFYTNSDKVFYKGAGRMQTTT
ncbi:MAG: FecR family protein [Saccharofermentans sp.]|nr:FecR family protein [Saccharofermentans sp.]